MFFRRQKAHQFTFNERLDALKQTGFAVQEQGSGKSRVGKQGCAAVIEDEGTGAPKVHQAGILVGNEIGLMMNGGYQMFFVTPSGKKVPALAEHLKALHAFEEDLREALGLVSLYNVSLGTRADQHMYDRVKGRDHGTTNRSGEQAPTHPPLK